MNPFKKAVVDALAKELNLPAAEVEQAVSVPPERSLGDYAFPCFSLAKQMRKSSAEIALGLQHKVKPGKLISKVESNGPYLNFFVDNAALAEETINAIAREKGKYGSMCVKGKKALIEHTSINPNASPHVGRARNSIIGDSLVRILKFHGYKTETHYFVNDVGKQIAMLVLGCKGKKMEFNDLLSEYVRINAELEKNPEIEKEIFALLKKLEDGDPKVRKDFRDVVELCVKGQSKIIADLGIKFDCFDYESEYLFSRKTDDVLKRLESTGKVFVDADGRKVLALEGFELDMKSPVLVLTRADGTSLYGLRDIAYTADKISKANGRNIVVLGEDHKLYFKQISAALSLLGLEPPEAVHYSFILLASGKMSTRSGNVVLLEEFMSQAVKKAEAEIKSRKKADYSKGLAKSIGYGAIKYHIIKVSPEKNVTFDWEQALSFEGESAPYIQYAHARICSILKKAGRPKLKKINYSLLKTKEELELVKLASIFPEVAEKAAEQLKPHLIANYLQQLADNFNSFYHCCHVISEDTEQSTARLALVSSVRQVLETGLSLLGIDAPERM